MIDALAENGRSGRSVEVDPLQRFKSNLSADRERFHDIPIEDYLRGVIGGVYPRPPRNATSLLEQALTAIPPFKNDQGIMEFPLISGREDELAILGINRSVETLMKVIRAEAALNSKDRIIVLVAPTGAGKTTLVKSVIDQLERYTDSSDKPPVYGIKECPINEDPLHIVDRVTRAEWKDRYGFEISGDLCPSCKNRAMIGHHEQMGFQPDKIFEKFSVHPLRYSLSSGVGIARVGADVASFMNHDSEQRIAQAKQNSNRGVLHFSEFGEFADRFTHTMHDFFRGREVSAGGMVFEVDTVVIADMTRDQWKEFAGKKANQSLVERMNVVKITYPLDPGAEMGILTKRIKAAQLGGLPHFAPGVLEIGAEIGVRSRYRMNEHGDSISFEDKTKLYSGVQIPGYSRRAVEEQSELMEEGQEGLSPAALWNILKDLIGKNIHIGADEGRGCVDYVEFIHEAEETMNSLIKEEPDLRIAVEQFIEVMQKFELDLIETVEKAFEDRFEERVADELKAYFEEVDVLLENAERFDPVDRGKRIPADLIRIKKFEDAVSGNGFSQDAQGEVQRQRFRVRLQAKVATYSRANNDKEIKHTDFYGEFPKFENGLKHLLSGGTGDARDILKAYALGPMTPDQRKKIEGIEGVQGEEGVIKRLIKEYDYCECCAPKMVKYVGSILRESDNRRMRNG